MTTPPHIERKKTKLRLQKVGFAAASLFDSSDDITQTNRRGKSRKQSANSRIQSAPASVFRSMSQAIAKLTTRLASAAVLRKRSEMRRIALQEGHRTKGA